MVSDPISLDQTIDVLPVNERSQTPIIASLPWPGYGDSVAITRANARLIAAAPTMYALLTRILARLASPQPMQDDELAAAIREVLEIAD